MPVQKLRAVDQGPRNIHPLFAPLGAAGIADAPETTLAVVLSFGAAALIYLIAEELLVETIEQEKSIFPTVMLFVGFLVLLALKLLG